MKWSPLYLAMLAPIAFLSSGALLGQTVVLIVTLAIFFGTLSLGRTKAASAAPHTERPLSR